MKSARATTRDISCDVDEVEYVSTHKTYGVSVEIEQSQW